MLVHRELLLERRVLQGKLRVGTEAPHRLRLPRDALASHVVQAVGLDQRDSDVPIKALIVGEVDLLLAALPEEAAHRIPTGYEGRGNGCGGR